MYKFFRKQYKIRYKLYCKQGRSRSAGVDFPSFQGPVEFGKVSFEPSKLGKLDRFCLQDLDLQFKTILNCNYIDLYNYLRIYMHKCL